MNIIFLEWKKNVAVLFLQMTCIITTIGTTTTTTSKSTSS